MGKISTTKDSELGLTINTAEGEISYTDLISWVKDYYSGVVTKLMLWDFNEADVSKITNDELKKIVLEIKKTATIRNGGKTALVFSKNIGFGMGRMYGAFSEIEGLPSEYRSFRSIEDAKIWLGI